MSGSGDDDGGDGAANVSMSGETVSSTVAQFAMAFVGFVGTIIFARLLGPASFGGFYLLFGLVKVADRPINGWGTAAKKRYSEADVPSSEVVGAVVGFIAVWAVISFFIAFASGGFLTSYTGMENAPVLFALLLVTVGVYEPVEQLVQARGRVGAATWMDTLRSLFTFPLQLACVVLLGLGAAGMAIGLAAASVLVIPLGAYVLKTRPAIPSKQLVRRLWTFARYSIPSSFFGTMYARMDVLLLGFLATQAAAANYEVAYKVALPALFLAKAIGNVLMPRVSNLRSRGSDASTDVSNALSFTSIIALPLFAGALALSRPVVVTLYGGEYANAASMLVAIAAYNLVASQGSPLRQTLSGLNRPEINMRLSGAALVVNVALGVVLIQYVGPVGVAIATLVAEGIMYGISAIVVRLELPEVHLFPRTLWEQAGMSAIMFAVVFVARGRFGVSGWFDLVALVALGAAVYGGGLLVVSRKLRHTIGSVLEGSRVEPYTPRWVMGWK